MISDLSHFNALKKRPSNLYFRIPSYQKHPLLCIRKLLIYAPAILWWFLSFRLIHGSLLSRPFGSLFLGTMVPTEASLSMPFLPTPFSSTIVLIAVSLFMCAICCHSLLIKRTTSIVVFIISLSSTSYHCPNVISLVPLDVYLLFWPTRHPYISWSKRLLGLAVWLLPSSLSPSKVCKQAMLIGELVCFRGVALCN